MDIKLRQRCNAQANRWQLHQGHALRWSFACRIILKLGAKMMPFKKSLNMNEILNMLTEDEDELDIYMEPPDVCNLTDEDSGDENLDGNCNADKLSRGQLMDPAELRPRNREVEEWLGSVYGSEQVPEFEKTAGSITLLHQLMVTAVQADHRAQVMLEDTRTRTEEYKAKGEQLASVLQGIGLSKCSLSPDAQDALANIADAACAVDARTPREADILLGHVRLECQHDQVLRQCEATQQLRSRLVVFSQQLSTKLDHINTLEQQAAAMSAVEKRELATSGRRQLFHEKKLSEYSAEICAREAELQHRGYTGTVNHDSVMQQWRKLQQLHEKVTALQRQLDSYSLPPDLNGARMAVLEARHTLNTLMEDMASVQAAVGKK